jgi:hypothetical protein
MSCAGGMTADKFKAPMSSNTVSLLDDPIVQLLLDGRAQTAAEAERLFVEEHLDEVVMLVNGPLSDEELRRHPLIAALLSHGSRGWDDSIL